MHVMVEILKIRSEKNKVKTYGLVITNANTVTFISMLKPPTTWNLKIVRYHAKPLCFLVKSSQKPTRQILLLFPFWRVTEA